MEDLNKNLEIEVKNDDIKNVEETVIVEKKLELETVEVEAEKVEDADQKVKPDKKSKRKTFSKTKKKPEAKVKEVKEKETMNRKTRRTIIGGIFTIFALIGVFATINLGVNTTAKILDNAKEKQEYNQLLANLVIYDPLPFENVEDADQKVLLLSSIWAAVMNEDMTSFDKNEYEETLLPLVVVDKYFASIFGSSYKLKYDTFEADGVTYEYNEEKQAYAIPITSPPTGYKPDVVDINTTLFSGAEKLLTVGYISPSTTWDEVQEKHISKYVDYVFEKQGSSYALVAIRESEKKVEISANSNSTAK